MNKRVSFVLPGGTSPINLFREFSKLKIDWTIIDFFWTDERLVSNKSKYSNFKLANELFLKKNNIKKKNIFSIVTNSTNLTKVKNSYQYRVKKYFNDKKCIFDLILLGMGSDGHIASIFPNKINFHNLDIAETVIRKDFNRVSISLSCINNSKNIYLWLNNKKKTRIYKKLISSKKKVPVKYLSKKKTKVFLIN